MNIILFLAALIPITVLIIQMIIFNKPAKEAIIIGWVITIAMALIVWNQNFLAVAGWSLCGFLDSANVLTIIFSAVLLMNILKNSNAMRSIQLMFNNINPDRRIQAILIGFVFSAFIEGAAGFGTPAAIAAPLLIGLGFPPLCAAMLCLIYNSIPVNFGSAGTPTLTAMRIVHKSVINSGYLPDVFLHHFTSMSALCNIICCPVIIAAGLFLICRLFGKEHRGKDAFSIFPFLLFTTFIFDICYFFTAFFLGPEFPSLFGSMMTMVIALTAAKKRFLCPRTIWTFDGYKKDDKYGAEIFCQEIKNQIFKAWIPYILLGIILTATRINFLGLKTILTSRLFSFSISNILKIDGITWNWNWGWCPGVIPFLLISVLSLILFKMPSALIKKTFKSTFSQCKGAALTLCFGISMVYIYQNTNFMSAENNSMIHILAVFISSIFHSCYIVLSPLIGVLGAFLTGSNTVSNTLFTGLQYETALLLNLSPVLIITLQNIGAAAGNMICINNIVAVCATTGISGREGYLIRNNFIPCMLYCMLSVIIIAIVQYLM